MERQKQLWIPPACGTWYEKDAHSKHTISNLRSWENAQQSHLDVGERGLHRRRGPLALETLLKLEARYRSRSSWPVVSSTIHISCTHA